MFFQNLCMLFFRDFEKSEVNITISNICLNTFMKCVVMKSDFLALRDFVITLLKSRPKKVCLFSNNLRMVKGIRVLGSRQQLHGCRVCLPGRAAACHRPAEVRCWCGGGYSAQNLSEKIFFGSFKRLTIVRETRKTHDNERIPSHEYFN